MKSSYCVFNKTTEAFLGLNVIRAETRLMRLIGLLGRFNLKSDEGLWLTPSRGIYALFPVDLIYLDASLRVVHLVEHSSSFRIAPIRLKNSSVLQLPPHTIYASQTRLGDQLLICLPGEMERNSGDTAVANDSLAAGNAGHDLSILGVSNLGVP